MKNLTIYITILLFSISLPAQSTFFKTFHLDDPAITTEFHKITQTSDGGFLITGTHSIGKTWVYVIKLDENGEEIWRLLREPFEDIFFAVERGTDVVEIGTEYIVLGTIAYPNEFDISTVLLMIDIEKGAINNIYEIEPLKGALCNRMVKTQDEQLAILGYDSFNEEHLHSWMTFTKVNLQGEIQWIQKYEMAAISSGMALDQGDIFQVENGDYYLAGGGKNTDINGRKVSIVKANNLGELIWIYENYESDQARSAAKVTSGIIATTDKLAGKEDVLFKVSNEGELIWLKDLSNYYNFSPIRCISTSEDNIYTIGSDLSDLVILKWDSVGNKIWENRIPMFNEKDRVSIRNITTTADDGIAIVGYAFIEPWTFHDGAFVLRLNSDGEFGDIVSTQNNIAFHDFDIDVFPNPTTDIVTIQNNATVSESYQLTLYDLKGVQQHQTKLSNQSMNINMLDYPSGAYILEIRTTDNQILHKTIVKE